MKLRFSGDPEGLRLDTPQRGVKARSEYLPFAQTIWSPEARTTLRLLKSTFPPADRCFQSLLARDRAKFLALG